MQTEFRVSLNAVRVFTVAAQQCSISEAANILCVTPSAVSHQIKKLETDLGVPLFSRSNNAIALTEAGQQFLAKTQAGITIIDHAVRSLIRDNQEIVVRSGISFAVRYLIPKLEKFKQLFPKARVRVETTHFTHQEPDPFIDVAIYYYRKSDTAPESSLLCKDLSLPMLSPALLAESGYQQIRDIQQLSALQCSENNWDWVYWEQQVGLKQGTVQTIYEFDTDDAAIRAAQAGLGMVLASQFMVAAEMEAGTLQALPDIEPVEMGGYYLQSTTQTTGLIQCFKEWLTEELSAKT